MVPLPLRLGKPPVELLTAWLARCTVRDARVVMGPRVGEDAAVIDLGDRYLVAKADPITFVAEEIGWYAVHVNANDLAVRGAQPAWFLMTLLLPDGTDAALVGKIFALGVAACAEGGATLVGGHTEVTAGLPRPILSGAMLGEVAKGRLVTTGGAQPGDAVLLSKGIALEGASILARTADAELAARGVAQELRARARDFLHRPGISVKADAAAATGAAAVHAMHDPTEGGLATGLWELAAAAGVGLRIDRAAIPVLPECAAACRALGLDPLGLIASGALLVTCGAGEADAVLRAWRGAGIPGAVIGRVVAPADGVMLTGPGAGPLPCFARDELARYFAETA
jgi:hydrogenase maturation factor